MRTVPMVFGEALSNPDNLREFLYQLEATSGSSFTKPRALIRLLQSKACRGAIMFGDELSYDQARKLVAAVAECDLPFQCAHGALVIAFFCSSFLHSYSTGRPSMVPLLNFGSLPFGQASTLSVPRKKKVDLSRISSALRCQSG